MIDSASLMAWSALAAIVTISPGPDTLLVTGHAIRGGRTQGLWAAAGIAAGGLWYIGLCGFGLLGLLVLVPEIYLAVKILGAAYLAWMGMGLVRAALWPKAVGEGADAAPRSTRLSHPFTQGLITNIANPKVAIFYLAALPQFAGAGADAPFNGAVMIAIHYTIGGLWLSALAIGAGAAGGMKLKAGVTRALDGAIGAFFLAIAARLALAER